MGIKVSQMPSTNTLTDNDLIMVVQDNENKKINKKDLQNNLTDPSLTKKVEELEKENAYLNNLVEQAFDKKEVEGEELSINDTIEAKMNVSLYGNTKQDGEPTPVTPVEIQSVTGNNSVSITGKNLFNGIFELGGYLITDGTKGSGNDRIRTTDFIKVNPNQTYSFSFENAGSVYVLEYDKNKAYLKYTLALYHVLSRNFTTDVKTEYITFYYIPYQHELSLNEKCQLEVGSTATEYEPYQSTSYPISLGDIELCKIGNYQDYFYKSGSIWYLHKEINKITSYNGETITTSYISTTGELSTGAKVYYVVTPTDTKITDTTLISQLEALKTTMSYAEQTNISQINDDIPFILKVTALASYNSRIVALENAILNANRSTQTKNARKSNEIIEETKEEVVDK